MLTQERLKELLHYNPDTGVFTWRIEHGPNTPEEANAAYLAAAKSSFGNFSREK